MVNSPRSMSRILFCSTALTFGGEQKQMVQILSHLDRVQFQPIVCCLRQFGYVERAIQDLATELFCLRVQSRYNLPGMVQRLHQVIREQGIDLIHMGIFGSEFSGLLAARSAGIPAVAILQTTYDLKARATTSNSAVWHCKWRTIYMMHAIMARMVNVHYVALSQVIKDSAVRHLHLPPERITVIPLGLNPEELDRRLLQEKVISQVKGELGLDGAYPILLNVARLSPVKGQKDLIQAMPRILESFPRAKLLIAGDGPLQSELDEMREHLGLREQVFLLGRRDDIKALLHASDLFVFGSYYEGLPGAAVEAMAAGIPIVAFDIPALREVVKHNQSGTLIPGRDTKQFSKAVIDLAERREVARNMGKQGQDIVKEKYDIRKNVRSLEALYRRMLAQI